jgi:hypothetical protein
MVDRIYNLRQGTLSTKDGFKNSIFLGEGRQTPRIGFAEIWVAYRSSEKHNKRFLLLFLEKEEY